MEQNNMKAFEENRQTIVPITFVDGNIKATEELNAMFTLPYDISVLSRAKVLDAVKNIDKDESISDEAFKSFAMDVARMNKNNLEDAVKLYLLMNCREFIYSFLRNMMDEICEANQSSNRYDDDDEFEGSYYYRNYVDDRTVDRLVEDQLNSFIFALSMHREMVSVYYYQLMNSLYYQVIAYVDTVIRNTVFSRYTNSKKNFKTLLAKVYGEGNPIDYNTLSPEFRYTFATSIMREMAEQKLPMLYDGLNKIFMTAASMSYTAYNPMSEAEIFGAAPQQITDNNVCTCGGHCSCGEH